MKSFQGIYNSEVFKSKTPEEQAEVVDDWKNAYVLPEVDEPDRQDASEFFNKKYPIKGSSFNVLDKAGQKARGVIDFSNAADFSKEVSDPKFRTNFGFMDNVEEQTQFLLKHPKIGEKGFKFNETGMPQLTPKAAKKFGIDTTVNIPIDSPALSNMLDLNDMSGYTGEMIGGTIGGIVSGPLGLVPSLATNYGGMALGKYLQEKIEAAHGFGSKSEGEMKASAHESGKVGAIVDTALRGLSPVGRYLSGGNLSRNFTMFKNRGGVFSKVDPKSRELSEYALKHDIIPTVKQATGRNAILGYAQRLADRIFGSPIEKQNAAAIIGQSRALTLKGSNKQTASKSTVNKNLMAAVGRKEKSLNHQLQQLENMADSGLSDSLAAIRKSLGNKNRLVAGQSRQMVHNLKTEWTTQAKEHYGAIDKVGGGRELVPTQGIKDSARSILNKFAKSGKDGRVLLTGNIKSELDKMVKMPDFVSFSQAHNMRSELGNMAYNPEFKGTPLQHKAGQLKDAVTQAMESAGERMSSLEKLLPGSIGNKLPQKEAYKAYLRANKFYSEGMSKFDNIEVSTFARDIKDGKGLENDEIVGYLMGLKSPTRVKRILNLLPETQQQEMRRGIFDELVDGATNLGGQVEAEALENSVKSLGKAGHSIFKTEGPMIQEYLKTLAVKNGKFDPSILKTGDIRTALEGAVRATVERDAYVKSNFVQMVKNNEYGSIVDTALQPENAALVNSIKGTLSKKEWQQFQYASGEQIGRKIFDNTTDTSKTLINASGYVKYVENLMQGSAKDNVLYNTFGKEHADELYKFAKMVKHVGTQSNRGGLVENYIALHPLANFGKIVKLKVLGNMLSDRMALNWFMNGIKVSEGVNVPGLATMVGLRPTFSHGVKSMRDAQDKGTQMIHKSIERAMEIAMRDHPEIFEKQGGAE